jgi:hypothetical protein
VKYITRTMLVSLLAVFSVPAMAVGVTGLTFAGGCVENAGNGTVCAMGSNATTNNVSIILGVAESDVTQVTSGFTAGLIGDNSGTWSVADPSITHIAFKSNGYFILGELVDNPPANGTWDNDTTASGGWDITIVDCPAEVCGSVRGYTDADFLNMGGEVAELSNVRAFSVVPVPAAVWLFGSGLGLLGWMRRRAVKVS